MIHLGDWYLSAKHLWGAGWTWVYAGRGQEVVDARRTRGVETGPVSDAVRHSVSNDYSRREVLRYNRGGFASYGVSVRAIVDLSQNGPASILPHRPSLLRRGTLPIVVPSPIPGMLPQTVAEPAGPLLAS